ncbi:FixH family protein [Ensifer sp. P24N7]|uniref:FixH family protein n=1 Tax=Sinorhizobium sp. P24N7 TaxID=3348358 RepID=UPI0035F23DA1
MASKKRIQCDGSGSTFSVFRSGRPDPRPGEFTGWHMPALILAFCATIIVVDLTMAVLASRSYTGFAVKNSHVAQLGIQSQGGRGAQAARGWSCPLQSAMARSAIA